MIQLAAAVFFMVWIATGYLLLKDDIRDKPLDYAWIIYTAFSSFFFAIIIIAGLLMIGALIGALFGAFN